MILTVTINPILIKRLQFDSVVAGKVNRSKFQSLFAGGKGINVSRQLNNLNVKNQAITVLGGANGKLLRHVLTEEEINFSAASIKSDIRYSTDVYEENEKRITSYFSPDFEITKKEVDEFKGRLERAIANCSIVVFSGSSPCRLADEIFPFGIETANKLDKISILDTYGQHLNNCIEKIPLTVHNNVEEVEKSLQIKLSSEKSKIEYLKSLYNKGIKLSFLTDGGKAAYICKYGFIHKVIPPKIELLDSTGSGDAFVAGIAFGLEKANVFNDFVIYASALGAANAEKLDACTVKNEEAEKLVDLIKINPIGKKMKIIDDSPDY